MNCWSISGNKNYVSDSTQKDENSSRIIIESNLPSYIFYKHDAYSFSKHPTHGSISIEENSYISVSSDIDIPNGGSAQLAAVVYSLDEDKNLYNETIWGTADSLNFPILDTYKYVVLVVRLRGAGQYQISNFSVEAMPLSDYAEVHDEIHQVFEFDPISTESISVEIETISGSKNPRSMIFIATWYDELGGVVPGVGDRAINPRLGPYDYLNAQGITEVSLKIPSGATKVDLQAILWSKNDQVFVRDDWKISATERDIHTLQDSTGAEKISMMLESLEDSTPLIVLHTTAPPLGHATLSLRPNRLAVEFQKQGYAVIFLPFSSVTEEVVEFDDNIWVVCRSLWPKLQHELARRQTGNNVFVCTSFPNFEALSAIDFLSAAGWKTAYEIRDDMEEFNRVGYSKWFDPQLEAYVAKRVDYLIAVSPRLVSKANIIADRNDAIVSPNAVSDYLLSEGRGLRTLEFQQKKFGSKVVGYLGHLTDSWFDWASVIEAAIRLPDFEFRIVGHGFPDRLVGTLPSNVAFLGPMTHEDFVLQSQDWTVGLIPFKPSPLTFGVDPNKLYEYLALGLRVVSAPMGSVDTAPWTSVYRSVNELVESILFQSEVAPDENSVVELNDYLKKSSWNVRALEMLQNLGGLN